MELSVLEVFSSSADMTLKIGKILSVHLGAGDILGFSGELGTGKTMMIRGICQGLEVAEKITSSSFVLMRILAGRLPVYHFDLYRLSSLEDIEDLGYDEYLYSDGVSMVEWSERMGLFTDPHYLQILLQYGNGNENMREIIFKADNTRFARVLKRLEASLSEAGIKIQSHRQ